MSQSTRRGRAAGKRSQAEARMVPDAEIRTYYDRPVLKEPVWKAYIPTYFLTGGLAAGSSLLAFGSALSGRSALARRSRLLALGAVGASAAALVADLGRPERAHHMLRVAKVTSPMSVGSWLLAAYGPVAGAAAGADLLGMPRGIERAADAAGATLAPVFACYTAVLVSDTAIPVWHEAHADLPFVFAAGAAASAGGLGVVLAPPGETRPARRMALAGAVGELVAVKRMERRLGELAEPYSRGRAGGLSKAATLVTAAGAALLALGGRRRAVAAAGGLLTMAGSALERFAVFEAGRQSARDPRYTVGPQRRRLTSSATASATPEPVTRQNQSTASNSQRRA
ncbi:MAG TPA: NrfD/PsrC family molybdoenzyme membrane anchor subunit [Actinomycetota bacterium]|nr:NrfD/PsrC family molybdoenzyme membrane anchor subunit [Actinomycetota bacterium]